MTVTRLLGFLLRPLGAYLDFWCVWKPKRAPPKSPNTEKKAIKNQSKIGKSLILVGGFSFKVEIMFFEKKRAEGKILIFAGGFMVKVAIVFFTIFIKSLV